jgi:hypothetical protein
MAQVMEQGPATAPEEMSGNEFCFMRQIRNIQSGSALLNAIIVAGIVAGVAGVILSQTGSTDKMSRNPRIKSAMTVLETQMLSMAMQPGLYQGCSEQAQNCQLNPVALNALQHLSRNITGAQCPSSSGGQGGQKGGSRGGNGQSSTTPACGVAVQAPSSLACLNSQNPGFNANCLAGQFYNPVTQTFCAEIFYQGSEVAMQAVCASTTVPQSVLQGDSTSCATATNLAGPYPRVIFRGYDGAGNAVCSAIPTCSGGNVSTPGNYISAIDKVTLQTQCKALNPSFLSCPAGTVLSNLKWNDVNSAFGTITPSADCVPRPLPADTHKIQAASPITLPPSTYTVTGGAPTTTLGGGSPPVTTPTTMPSTGPWNFVQAGFIAAQASCGSTGGCTPPNWLGCASNCSSIPSGPLEPLVITGGTTFSATPPNNSYCTTATNGCNYYCFPDYLLGAVPPSVTLTQAQNAASGGPTEWTCVAP